MLNHRCVHAFKVWLDIEQALRSAAECFLFLDFDGTLSPIVSNPHQAELAPRAQDLLGGLQRMPGMRIAIISGRSRTGFHPISRKASCHAIATAKKP